MHGVWDAGGLAGPHLVRLMRVEAGPLKLWRVGGLDGLAPQNEGARHVINKRCIKPLNC